MANIVALFRDVALVFLVVYDQEVDGAWAYCTLLFADGWYCISDNNYTPSNNFYPIALLLLLTVSRFALWQVFAYALKFSLLFLGYKNSDVSNKLNFVYVYSSFPWASIYI